jgi:site-specific recombinase XerD
MATYIQPTDFVFASASGRPMNPDVLRVHLQETLRTMGISLGPREDGLHLLRHSSGSLVYQATADVKATQAWLGHSNARTTMDVYTHLAAGHEERSAHKLEQAIFASPRVKTQGEA